MWECHYRFLLTFCVRNMKTMVYRFVGNTSTGKYVELQLEMDIKKYTQTNTHTHILTDYDDYEGIVMIIKRRTRQEGRKKKLAKLSFMVRISDMIIISWEKY